MLPEVERKIRGALVSYEIEQTDTGKIRVEYDEYEQNVPVTIFINTRRIQAEVELTQPKAVRLHEALGEAIE